MYEGIMKSMTPSFCSWCHTLIAKFKKGGYDLNFCLNITTSFFSGLKTTQIKFWSNTGANLAQFVVSCLSCRIECELMLILFSSRITELCILPKLWPHCTRRHFGRWKLLSLQVSLMHICAFTHYICRSFKRGADTIFPSFLSSIFCCFK